MPRPVIPALLTWLLCIVTGSVHAAAQAGSGFFLHDGDTVVFYGDSITEQQMYARDIEDYVATRFPTWHVRFINSGWSGDRVTGGGGGDIEVRLRRDVLPYKPTVVTLFLGMNDGSYTSFDPAIFQTYKNGLTHIVDELKQRLPGVRLTLFTPSMFDYAARDRPPKPAGQGYNYAYPAPDYNEVLLRYGEYVKQLGTERGLTVVDLNAPMMAATAKGRETDPKFALSGDGVHPNEVGHLIMAAAVLQAWHAPAEAADISLSPGKPATFMTPLPWPIPDAARPAFAVSQLPGELDNYRVHATGLPGASYTLEIDGKPVGTFTPAQLAAGIDLTQYPDLPMNRQAQDAAKAIEQRIDIWHNLWKDNGQGIAHDGDIPSASEVRALVAIQNWLDTLRAGAHNAAQPGTHSFALVAASSAR